MDSNKTNSRRKKLKMFIFAGILTIIVVIALIPLTISIYFIRQIQKYPKLTHEDLYNDPEKRQMYGLHDNRDPADFGFPNFSEYSFNSFFDQVPLSGWFIPAENKESTKCIILFHGRTSNRLRPLKFLELIKEKGLNREFAIFIPDLRNSGNSGDAKTYMGYKYAEDIYSCTRFLHERNKLDSFIFWGFSMGGLAACLSLQRFRDDLSRKGVTVSKVILDSPLSNVPRQLHFIGKNEKVPGFITSMAIFLFNYTINFQIDNMRLSKVIKDVKAPVLILQSKSDKYVPYFILQDELALLTIPVDSYIFDEGEHVEVYSVPENKEKYTDLVYTFIEQ